MPADNAEIVQLKKTYEEIKSKIVWRLNEFRRLWDGGAEEELFAEVAFCLLTPQSKAKVCWGAVEGLRAKKLLLYGNAIQIAKELRGVRFHNVKARRIVKARALFMSNGNIAVRPLLTQFDNNQEARDWLVRNVEGFGYKEASHFLRNIGLGSGLAILDRHILKNLSHLGVIGTLQKSLSGHKYMEVERRMKGFAEEIKIPMEHLDLLLWYRETGEVFK